MNEKAVREPETAVAATDLGLDAGAVLVVDEFEEEQVEEDDEQRENGPKGRRQAAQVVAVPVQRDHVVLVRRSLLHLHTHTHTQVHQVCNESHQVNFGIDLRLG